MGTIYIYIYIYIYFLIIYADSFLLFSSCLFVLWRDKYLSALA